MYEVGMNIVADGYVRNKTLHQYIKYEPIFSQRTTCVAPRNDSFIVGLVNPTYKLNLIAL